MLLNILFICLFSSTIVQHKRKTWRMASSHLLLLLYSLMLTMLVPDVCNGDMFPERRCHTPDGSCYVLRHVCSVFRHGPIGPKVVPPGDAFMSKKLYPRGLGMPTALGLQQTSDVGRIWSSWLRAHYFSGTNI